MSSKFSLRANVKFDITGIGKKFKAKFVYSKRNSSKGWPRKIFTFDFFTHPRVHVGDAFVRSDNARAHLLKVGSVNTTHRQQQEGQGTKNGVKQSSKVKHRKSERW